MVAASLTNLHSHSRPCHSEAEESAAKRRTPNEGPMHLAGALAATWECIGPSARRKRGPQDDNVIKIRGRNSYAGMPRRQAR